jgi:hypothetical protein
MVDVYHKYPYYDDVLYPLSDILQRSVNNQQHLSTLDYQWNSKNLAFLEIVRNPNIDKIHDFLYRALLWQRWVVQKTYQVSSTKIIE